MRGAVLKLVDVLEAAVAAQVWPEIFRSAHEIRGPCGDRRAWQRPGGWPTRSASIWMRCMSLAVEPDPTVVGLHTDAIARFGAHRR